MSGGRNKFRDWKPGDGLNCRYARQAPLEIPCGPPVRTCESEQDHMGRGPRTVVSPLCENHADLGKPPPMKVLIEAKRVASEKIITENWETYNQYLKAAIAEIRDRA